MRTTETQPTNFETVNDVGKANKAIQHHWFEKSTMSFFNTRIETTGKLINKRFFITSEQFVPSSGIPEPRMFTIRVALPDGKVNTYGEFQAYKTRGEAIAAAHKIG